MIKGKGCLTMYIYISTFFVSQSGGKCFLGNTPLIRYVALTIKDCGYCFSWDSEYTILFKQKVGVIDVFLLDHTISFHT